MQTRSVNYIQYILSLSQWTASDENPDAATNTARNANDSHLQSTSAATTPTCCYRSRHLALHATTHHGDPTKKLHQWAGASH